MRTVLFYDTETTNTPDWHKPSDSPHQPHIVQLSAILMDIEAREEIEVHDHIIKPDGWSWDENDEAFKTHGITMEYAEEHGVPEDWAVEQFRNLHELCELRVGHNEPFDARIVRIALKRYGMLDWANDVFKSWPRMCTGRMSTKLCEIPPTEAMVRARRNHFKTPSLEEAHEILLGEKFENAHDGLADCRASARVFFECLDRGVELKPTC